MTVGSLRAWGLKGQGWNYTGERNAEERQFCAGQNNEAAFGCAGGQGELGLFALDSTRGRRGLVKVYSTAHVSVECPVCGFEGRLHCTSTRLRHESSAKRMPSP